MATLLHRHCQICGKKGLTLAREKALRGRKVIVCHNEYVRHIRIAGKHYLCRAIPEVELEITLN